MNWTPFVLFLAAGVFESWAARRYFNALEAAQGTQQSHGDEFIAEALRKPRSILLISVREGINRIKLIFGRQESAAVEHRRWLALIGLIASTTSFGLLFVAAGR